MKIWSSMNLPWGYARSHTKFGPDQFNRFDVYWIQTNKQTNKQTYRQAKFIYRFWNYKFKLPKPDKKKLSFKVFDQVRLFNLFILSFLRKKSFDKLDNSNGLVSWLLQACTILELLSYRVSEKKRLSMFWTKFSKFLFATDFRYKK